jgi:hypothetical protein
LSGSGVKQYSSITQADTILVSVYVRSITTSVKIDVYTVSQDGSKKIINFPLLTAPTSELVIEQAAATLSNLRLDIDHVGDCDLDVVFRGVTGGTTSNSIVFGAASATAYNIVATSTPAVLVPSAITDRQGLILKNYGSGDTLFVGFTISEASTASGWPMSQGETIAIDLQAGQAIYAVSSGANINVRVMEANS